MEGITNTNELRMAISLAVQGEGADDASDVDFVLVLLCLAISLP